MKRLIVFAITFVLTTGALAQSNIFNMTDTWNDAGTTFDAIKMNVTDTASQADSKLLNLQVGGTPMFTVDKAGNPVAAGGFPWNIEDTINANYGHGLRALDSVTVGSGQANIAIGEDAGTGITTGDYNVVIGWHAGMGLTLHNRSVFIGREAGNAGADNIGVGFDALHSSSGNLNIGIGEKTLYGVSGSENVAVGHYAGHDSGRSPL